MHVACDRAIAAHWGASDGKQRRVAQRPKLMLATTILASSLAFIDGSVVNVGLPSVSRSLGASGPTLTWVVNGYMLPLSSLLLFGGALGDIFGRRRLLSSGVGLFTVASIACALSPSLGWLLAGRVLQGIGAALLLPNSLAILGTTFVGQARGRAVGIWAGVGAAAGAVGPVLGGWLIDRLGWRAIFLLNVPLGSAAFYLAARYVPSRIHTGSASVDLLGAVVATAALTLLTWALTIASSPASWGAAGLTGLSAGLLLLALFIFIERRRGAAAMLPGELFSSASFIRLNTFTLLLYGALSALLVSIPFVLIEVRHYSATAAGAALLPLPLIMASLSPTIGRTAERLGSRWLLTAGALVVAGGCLLAAHIGTDGSYWTTTFGPILVVSLGMASAVSPLTTAVLSSVDQQHVGVASGFNSAVARAGGLIATALLSAVLTTQGPGHSSSLRSVAMASAAACLAAAVCSFGIPTSGKGRTNR
jgi:EmrB/QacA subfamily drug resistance transporter